MLFRSREREADVRSVLAEWLWFRGDFKAALTTARSASSMHLELGVQRYLAHDRLVEGMALATLGNYREALQVLEDAIAQAERMDHPEWIAHALVPLGVALRALRRLGRARQVFRRAAELGDRIGALMATSLLARTYMGDQCEYYAGISGNYAHKASMQLFHDADLVIGVGASLNRYTLENGYLYQIGRAHV